MKERQFNINDNVRVELTKRGVEIYNKYLSQCRYTYRKHTVEGEVLKEQLWCLMSIFGEHIGLGLESPFKECLIEFV